ncbi:MAG: hypothetical protein VX640_03765 [Pseudomonadota bacterium]|nr:hypothetical protein [Pseudomonadota bacterium]
MDSGLSKSNLERVAREPKTHDFATILFSRPVDENGVKELVKVVSQFIHAGASGVHITIHSGGGVPTNGPFFGSVIRTMNLAAIGHVAGDAFSEAGNLFASFPYRTISHTGRVGFHQASMKLDAGSYPESRISDLLSQVRGLNQSMIENVVKALGVSDTEARKWFAEGATFVGEQAKLARIAHEVLEPKIDKYDIMLMG